LPVCTWALKLELTLKIAPVFRRELEPGHVLESKLLVPVRAQDDVPELLGGGEFPGVPEVVLEGLAALLAQLAGGGLDVLILDCRDDIRMAVPKGVDSDAAEKVEILLPGRIPKRNARSSDEAHR